MDSDSDCEKVAYQNRGKKRQKYGRMREVMKKIKLQSHEFGESCSCKQKCFEKLPLEAKMSVLRNFNTLKSNDEQNSYLCGLISVLPVRRRRPRKAEEEANLRTAVFSYRIRFIVNNFPEEIQVCRQTFMSIHGIKKKKLSYLQNALKLTGVAPRDKRGQNINHPRKMQQNVYETIFNHIQSFKGRKSHYSVKDSKRIYLPEELNIKEMFGMFCDSHSTIKTSYESYRRIFNTKFNLFLDTPVLIHVVHVIHL